MAALNNDCVRDLILWIEKTQQVKPNGKPDPLHMRDAYPALPKYPREDIGTAATYLVGKKLIALASGQSFPETTSSKFTVTYITASGYDYLAAIRDDTVWKKIKEHLGSAMLASVPTVIELAAKLL